MRPKSLICGLLITAIAVVGCGDSGGGSTRPSTATATVAGAPTVARATITPLAAAPPGGYLSAISGETVDNKAFDKLEADILKRVRAVGLPGASLLVVQHGKLVEQEAWLEYKLDTVVPIASGSKWLTAAMIMTLVDEGKIGLDVPLSTYAPAATGQVGRITMRQLLSLTSGIIADENVPCYMDGAVSLQECARDFLARGLVHPAGEAFRYGGQHMAVAGAVAEIVTGKSFVDLFQERIAGPLHMTKTGFYQVGTGARDSVTHPSPAGSAYSSLGDYGRFLEMIYHDGVAPDGKRILSSASIAEMQKNQIAGARYGNAAAFRMADKAPYGLGEWLDWTDLNGNALVLSSDGAWGFRPWLDKKNDLFGVYLIFDRGEGYVEGDPGATAADEKKVQTSGLWVFRDTAAALGGSLPQDQYPDR